MIKTPLLALGLALLCFTSCQKSSTDVAPVNAAPSNVTSSASNAATAVATNLDNAALLKLVNDVRAKGCTCGVTAMPAVGALAWNDLLAAAALVHSAEMKSSGLFSHDSPNGTSFSARVTAAGYKWTTVGENIAAGQTTETEVFNAWLKSEGHCKNMMAASFKEMGAARVNNYWTQDFAAR